MGHCYGSLLCSVIYISPVIWDSRYEDQKTNQELVLFFPNLIDAAQTLTPLPQQLNLLSKPKGKEGVMHILNEAEISAVFCSGDKVEKVCWWFEDFDSPNSLNSIHLLLSSFFLTSFSFNLCCAISRFYNLKTSFHISNTSSLLIQFLSPPHVRIPLLPRLLSFLGNKFWNWVLPCHSHFVLLNLLILPQFATQAVPLQSPKVASCPTPTSLLLSAAHLIQVWNYYPQTFTLVIYL